MSANDLDRYLWDITCQWHLYSDMKIIHNGLDYSELTQSFLWDKIPRAVRNEKNSARIIPEFESSKKEKKSIFSRLIANISPFSLKTLFRLKHLQIKNLYHQMIQPNLHNPVLDDQKILYVPIDASKYRDIIHALSKPDDIKIVICRRNVIMSPIELNRNVTLWI